MHALLLAVVDLLAASGGGGAPPPTRPGTGHVDGTETGAASGRFVGLANRFASHAWKYDFRDVISALEQAEVAWSKQRDTSSAGGDTAQLYWWFDICTVNQQPEAQQQFPPDYFYNAFKDGIGSIGHTVRWWAAKHVQWGMERVMVWCSHRGFKLVALVRARTLVQ